MEDFWTFVATQYCISSIHTYGTPVFVWIVFHHHRSGCTFGIIWIERNI